MGHHEILHCEEIEISNGKRHEVFEIEIATEDHAPGEYPFTKVMVPNYPGIILIFECDLLDIESIENVECENVAQ